MQFKNYFFETSDGHQLWVNRWMPDEGQKIKAVIQLHHGLAEHTLRYDRFGSILAENGYVLNAYDMRGHGRTGENSESNNSGLMGKLADKNGFMRVVDDLDEMIAQDKKDFPDTPVILFGHSFGSFISQAYLEKYGSNIKACVLSGTAGPRNALIAVAKPLVSVITFFRGKNTVVPFLSRLAFGSYNAKIQNPVSANAWLSRNEMNVQTYDMDKWCGIDLRAGFFKDMMTGLSYIHNSKNMKKIPAELPLLFIYGKEDPVGDYGKTIEKLIGIYRKNGVSDITVKAYENDRHELLNEDDRETVENDILSWLSKVLS